MQIQKTGYRGVALLALVGLAVSTAGCGTWEQSVRIYPPAETESDADPRHALDRLLPNTKVTVILADAARFEGKYDGRDGELFRFEDIDWRCTKPEPSIWRPKKESFSADEIAEIHEMQLTGSGKVVAGVSLAVLVGMFIVWGEAQGDYDDVEE